MLKFKLIEEKETEKEWHWTYSIEFKFIFNNLIINYLTITDHPWKKPGREEITKELILNIFQTEINGKRFFPTDYQGIRKVFLREGVPFENKKYRLVFWFKDKTTNHLWIRNCHEQN
ncbi:MAG: hypothetical protein I3273_04575 [Candidatus Moeniiplasma glomeromycotorum]|nr:hypothetical protein [Candidatus Moeniiplasma glomeromycotorum]MCE8169370.1 hypothetical protein [Candidatus Moeniiplasma glomeromycotorum]